MGLELTMYMIKACIVSMLVVRRKLALLSAVSVPTFIFSTREALLNPNSPIISGSSMLTAALNQHEKTRAWMEGRGSMPLLTSSQN